MQEPVRQACALDHDMVGELKTTLKGPLGDALVEYLARLFLFVFFAADRQRVFLRFDRKSASVNPATATEMRKAFSPFRSIL